MTNALPAPPTDIEAAVSSDLSRQPSPRSRLLRVFLALTIAALMGAFAFHAFTRHNDFPLHYHPDEPSKVEQLRSPTQARNLNHPLLMLEAAHLWMEARETDRDDALAVAIAGRSTSAALASIAVVAFALVGYATAGFIGLAIVGTMAMLCPPLLVYAHFLKEDAALICGIAIVMLGTRWMTLAQSARAQLLAAIVLGAGCAAATSGKFVGVATLVPAAVTLAIAPLSRRWLLPARVVLFALAALGTIVGINARAFDDPWTLTRSERMQETLHENFAHATGHHGGLTLPKPNAFLHGIATSEVMPHAWIFAAIGAAGIVIIRLRHGRAPFDRWALIMATLAATYAVVLAFNVLPFTRYALPMTVIAYVAAGLLIACVVQRLPPAYHEFRFGVAAGCATIALVAQGTRCYDFNRQFADDSRQRLREWVAANTSRNDRIAADLFTSLATRGDPHRFPNQHPIRPRIERRMYAADVGTLDALAQRGIRYVAVSHLNYARFFIPGAHGIDDHDEWFAHRQQFYSDLFARGELVWSSTPNPPTHANVNPELRVYRIDHLRPGGRVP